MKATKYIVLSLICVCSLVSCDYLDKEPDTELTLDMVFEKRGTVEKWFANVYAGIPDPTYPYLKTVGWETMADDMSPSEKYQQWGWEMIPCSMGNWSPSTTWEPSYWQRYPQWIRGAYQFIENAYPLPEQEISASEMASMKAECRLLADYYFYLLLNTYGPIPFKPNYIAPVDGDLADLMVGQTPYDEVIDWLEKDMLAVSRGLPAVYNDSRKEGRMTSLAALAIRSRMLLFAASDLVNGNTEYAGHKNDKGVELFNSTYSIEKWERAAKAAKLLIDEARKAGADLYREYKADGTIDPFLSCQNVHLVSGSNGNKEILMMRPKNEGNNWDRYCMPSGSGSSSTGGVSATQSLVDAFFDKTGLPIDDVNTVYVEDGFSSADSRWDTKWPSRKNGVITQKGTYNMYCNREPRFYVNVYYDNSWFAKGNRYLNFLDKKDDNKGTHDAPQAGYLIRKKTHPDSDQKGGYKWRPGILFRLAEAYLNYAEALNEWKDDNASRREALDYVNLIRERAGIRKYTLEATDKNDEEYIQLEDTKEAVRKAIRMERRVELCCEGIRYDDLRRWKEAETVLNGDFIGMNFKGTVRTDDPNNKNAFYKRVTYQSTRVFRKSFYWFPIYQKEIDKNLNLRQAPFWE